jgi:N-acetylmuramoyl-L-alanine amidase
VQFRPLFLAALTAAALPLGAYAGPSEDRKSLQSELPSAPTPTDPPLRPPDVVPPEGPINPFPAPTAQVERNVWRYIVIHHSASPSGNAASFNRMHQRKGWDGLAYHFVICNGKGGADGELQVGARWWKQKHGAHAGGLHGVTLPDERNEYNEFGIGICLVGNLDQRAPTKKQLKTLAGLVKKLRNDYGISEDSIVGHRHVKSTACPGRHFPWKTLWAMMDLPAPQHLAKRYPGATYDRCSWCVEHEYAAQPADPRYSGASRTPGAASPTSSELPPQVFLQGR